MELKKEINGVTYKLSQDDPTCGEFKSCADCTWGTNRNFLPGIVFSIDDESYCHGEKDIRELAKMLLTGADMMKKDGSPGQEILMDPYLNEHIDDYLKELNRAKRNG